MLHDTLWPTYDQAMGPELISAFKFKLYRSIKRYLDLVITLVVLLLLWPLLLGLALLIKLDSCGPAIFAQKRVGARWCGAGLAGHWQVITFQCYKFRTMIDGCDQARHEAFIRAFIAGEVQQEGSLPFKLKDDPRVTRLGNFLRKSSLDELPQLLNILKGEMSLVGPRPVPLYEVAAYQAWHRERLNALPGLTGLWQVTGRSRVSFDEMVRLDIEYVRHPSLWIDLKILLLTVPSVLAGRGAN